MKAPTPRFGFFAFWILAATWVSIAAVPTVARIRVRQGFFALVCLFVVATVGIRAFGTLRRQGAHEALSLLVNTSGPDDGFYPFPKVSFRSVTTASGLILAVPTRDGRIYDAPLLATPWPTRTLELRYPGDLGRGFRAVAKTTGITG